MSPIDGRVFAHVALGGKRVMAETGGFFVEPTILDGARNDMRVAQEEIFGPVVVVIRFEDEAEATRLANATIYSLGAAVWTADMNVAHRLSRAIKAGTVWVNAFDRSSMTTPFGGFKQSGFGRDRSPHAVDKHTDLKTIWTACRRARVGLPPCSPRGRARLIFSPPLSRRSRHDRRVQAPRHGAQSRHHGH